MPVQRQTKLVALLLGDTSIRDQIVHPVTDSGTSTVLVLVHPDPPALLLLLDQILNVKLIVVDQAYCCLLLVLNSNNINFY